MFSESLSKKSTKLRVLSALTRSSGDLSAFYPRWFSESFCGEESLNVFFFRKMKILNWLKGKLYHTHL